MTVPVDNLVGLIDNRNRQFFQDLKSVHIIDVEFENRNDYACFSRDNHSIIYVPKSDKKPSSFTHELLHVYLRTKEVFIGAALKISINDSPVLKIYFDNHLVEHIGNSLDHVKMLPLFKQLGFHQSEFITDFEVDKLTEAQIQTLKSKFEAKWFLKTLKFKQAFKLFIGKYFAVKACPNPNFNYENKLSRLREIHPELYDINETFFNAWTAFDYNDGDLIIGGYHVFLHDYISELENLLTNERK